MIIHVVQPGETINSIADKYEISADRLILDNDLTNFRDLVVGQTIVVAIPLQTYVVQEGDVLMNIASNHGVTLLQLYRNNPFLSDREFLYPGETLVISYHNNAKKIRTNGYTFEFIDKDILKKTLPFLTYLSIFGYRFLENASIEKINDTEIIKMAKDYGVTPIMVLSSFNLQGVGSVDTIYRVFGSEELSDRLINNILSILKEKGYYGFNFTYYYYNAENKSIYVNFTHKLTKRLNQEGFFVSITLTQNIIIHQNEITYQKLDYTSIGEDVNGVIISLNFHWGTSYGPPTPVTSIYNMKDFLDYILTQVPNSKIDIAVPIIAYDWELPYVIGSTRAESLTIASAINIAQQNGVNIQFDEISMTPYFEYSVEKFGVQVKHIVWFIDARYIDSSIKLVEEYELHGTVMWSIMQYYAQMWLVINSQYEIETIL